MKSIPLVDLNAQYHSIKEEIDNAILSCIEKGRFIGGESVKNFEEQFADFCSMPYCASCGNGTDALEIALKILGIGEGDEVIVPAMTFVASAEAALNVGASVKLCDVSSDTYLIDPELFEKSITPKTKAVIVVHLYGQMADMDKITKIAKKHNIYVIEDSAQAVGAKFNNKGPGILGDIATFSFFPGKNLGAYGDAGAMVTNNKKLYHEFKKMANHGRLSKFGHEAIGRNSRLDTIQATILSIKLKYLKEWTRQRQRVAYEYTRLLSDFKQVALPVKNSQANHVYHLYVIRVARENREKLLNFLKEKNIQAGIHYPQALQDIEALAYLNHKSLDFPNASALANECISLPVYPELSKDKIEYIVQNIKSFFALT